jgi:hypothetical protein
MLYKLKLALALSATALITACGGGSGTANHMIRMITSAGVVTTLAGSTTSGYAEGTGATARFKYPYGVSINANGLLYVADRNNWTIRKIAP